MLTPGTPFGSYEILSTLGAGGMGEVFRARDTRLNRDVALKILLPAVAGDPDRMARFSREAQLLASLNHPNIAHVHGLEESGGVRALVMELVEGQTLADRIAQGAIPLNEALPIAGQIAEALATAHEQGIIHRDLKPANIKVRPDGTVKVLDFGLAKAMESGRLGESAGLSLSPTISLHATQAGIILGTAAYMSPEQAAGKPVDKRSDLWAFGVVLLEMLTGRQVFGGETVSHVLASVLKDEPDLNALPIDTPLPVRKLLRRCLEKDRKRRLDSAADARLEIDEAASGAVDTVSGVPSPAGAAAPAWMRAVPWALAGVLGAALLIALWSPWRKAESPAARRVTRFTIAAPGALFSGATSAGPMTMSSDGARLAYVAQSDTGTRLIHVREMDQLEARPLRETEGIGGMTSAGAPFFSADGRWIGFVAGGKLRKVPAGGGPTSTICEFTGAWRGATWLPDDTIIAGIESQEQSGLFRVPASGGALTPVARVEKPGEVYRWPDALPGGKAVLFATQTGGDSSGASITLLRLDNGERRVLAQGGSYPRYVPSGHIVFARAGTLLAVPFDLGTLRITGAPAPVIERVAMTFGPGQTQFAVSQSGTLVYATAGDEGAQSLVWVDRKGVAQPIAAAPQNFEHPRLSPDGQRLAVDIRGYAGSATTDVWLFQFARGTLSRLTFGHSEAEAPVWTPDGSRVTYAVSVSDQAQRAVAWTPADNSGAEEVLAQGTAHLHPLQWSARGDVLLLNQSGGPASDTWGLFMDDKRTLRPIATTPFAESAAALSPDGRWIAYTSDETGRNEVYAQAFPGPGGKVQISGGGGVEPVWARGGRELFFRDGEKMMAVAMDSGGAALSAGTPQVLFQGRFVGSTSGDRWYDVTADGQRFLMLKPQETVRSIPLITVVQDWSTELARLSPRAR